VRPNVRLRTLGSKKYGASITGILAREKLIAASVMSNILDQYQNESEREKIGR
jgi:hypothetical protein